ncbi:Hypothetical_protein [Hexamita inflata]|uniref:Hypothetical_protein n=1 Tax=Hexamita inflata TaxID=28002 RepID=A0ABP1H4P6_9EUKA
MSECKHINFHKYFSNGVHSCARGKYEDYTNNIIFMCKESCKSRGIFDARYSRSCITAKEELSQFFSITIFTSIGYREIVNNFNQCRPNWSSGCRTNFTYFPQIKLIDLKAKIARKRYRVVSRILISNSQAQIFPDFKIAGCILAIARYSHSNLKAGISNLFLARLHAICVCHHFKEDFDCFPKILPSFSEIQLFTLFNRYFVIFIMATLDFSLVRFILELLKTRIQNIQKNISFNSILKFIQTFIIQYSNYYRNFIIFLMADL